MKTRPGTILGFAGPPWVRNQPEHHRPTVITTLNKYGTVAADYNATETAARADRLLTREGQEENIKKAKAAAFSALDAIDVDTTKITERADGIEKALLAKHASSLPKDVPHDAKRWIWDQMRDMTRAERINIYRSPNTDPLVLLAIETAPPALGTTRADGSRRFESFVDAEELAAARMERAEASDPQSATTMHELRSLAEVFRLASNSVRREIEDAAGVTVPEGAQP